MNKNEYRRIIKQFVVDGENHNAIQFSNMVKMPLYFANTFDGKNPILCDQYELKDFPDFVIGRFLIKTNFTRWRVIHKKTSYFVIEHDNKAQLIKQFNEMKDRVELARTKMTEQELMFHETQYNKLLEESYKETE